MTFSPSFNIVLKDELSERERQDVLDKVRKLDGVLGADFNESAKPPKSSIFVNYTTRDVIKNPVNEAARIPGVKKIRHYD
jgi:hypothetical protein